MPNQRDEGVKGSGTKGNGAAAPAEGSIHRVDGKGGKHQETRKAILAGRRFPALHGRILLESQNRDLSAKQLRPAQDPRSAPTTQPSECCAESVGPGSASPAFCWRGPPILRTHRPAIVRRSFCERRQGAAASRGKKFRWHVVQGGRRAGIKVATDAYQAGEYISRTRSVAVDLVNVRPKWALTIAQATALLAELPPLARTMVGLALLSGLRRGELFALRWRDFDEPAQSLTVVRRSTTAR